MYGMKQQMTAFIDRLRYIILSTVIYDSCNSLEIDKL